MWRPARRVRPWRGGPRRLRSDKHSIAVHTPSDRRDPLERLLVDAARRPDGKLGLLGVTAVAQVLGKRPAWVYANAAWLGALRLGPGRRSGLALDPRDLAQRLAATRAHEHAAVPSAPRQRARSTARGRGTSSVELFPVKPRQLLDDATQRKRAS